MSFFEMNYQLVDVLKTKKLGWSNCVDITVDNDEHAFILANGLVSHNSAMGGLLPSLGRNGNAFYMLKGKPLNAYSNTQAKFLANKELSSLYQIIKNGVNIEELPESDYYEIDLNGNKSIVNINDEIKIGDTWVAVEDIIKAKND